MRRLLRLATRNEDDATLLEIAQARFILIATPVLFGVAFLVMYLVVKNLVVWLFS